MPLTEATILLEGASAGKSPQAARSEDARSRLGIWPHCPLEDQQALERLVPWAKAFSPRVGVDLQPLDAGLLLDMTGLAARHGGEEALSRQLLSELRQLGYGARLGWADTLGAAWALAHFGHTACSPPLSPSSSSDDSPRCPIYIAPPGQTDQVLAPLPVAALRLSEATLGWLRELGVTQIGQLADLPRAGIASRFGAELLRRCDQVRGRCDETFEAHEPAVPFVARWDAEYPTDRGEVLERVVEHLSQHLAQMLAHRQRGALQLRCRLHCEGVEDEGRERPAAEEAARQAAGRLRELDVNLFQPTVRADYLWQLLRSQLESLPLPGPVRAVELLALATAPLAHHQPLLWDQEAGAEQVQQLSALIDRLSNRLGPDVVSTARLTADVLPEAAYKLLPLVGAQAARARSQASPAIPPAPDHRPLQLIHPPQPVEMLSESCQGEPQQFVAAGSLYQSARCWGPERIETAWWQGSSVRRDYYRVQCTSGARWWLFRDLKDQSWFLQGEFL
jgi:protein ImuB